MSARRFGCTSVAARTYRGTRTRPLAMPSSARARRKVAIFGARPAPSREASSAHVPTNRLGFAPRASTQTPASTVEITCMPAERPNISGKYWVPWSSRPITGAMAVVDIVESAIMVKALVETTAKRRCAGNLSCVGTGPIFAHSRQLCRSR